MVTKHSTVIKETALLKVVQKKYVRKPLNSSEVDLEITRYRRK